MTEKIIETYDFTTNDIPVTVKIVRTDADFVLNYVLSLPEISNPTKLVLEKIRRDLIKSVSFNIMDITELKKRLNIDEQLKKTIDLLVVRYFPDVEQDIHNFLVSWLIQRSIGMGNIEFLMNDKHLEEITINSFTEPVWVYHIKHGWLKTNITIDSEEQIKHYASMIGRKVGRQLTALMPLLDAYLDNDRVNATLAPISTKGNTITIRKFARDPWTITKLLQNKTISVKAACLIWLAMQYELSALVIGGTASGKTSTLNVLGSFFPPNQRIISIEDTREISLPKYLHWVPLLTRMPNAEGRGLISMEDLLVNSLRMRPDRLIVGEVRRREEATTLFEAIHTGHSVYSTFHANDSNEAVTRLLNPPISVPKTMLPGLSLMITQFRNRRTGVRRIFEIAEITPDAAPNVIMRYDFKTDSIRETGKSVSLMNTLKHVTGMSDREIEESLKEKETVLNYLIKKNITDVNDVGMIIAKYYSDPKSLLEEISKNK